MIVMLPNYRPSGAYIHPFVPLCGLVSLWQKCNTKLPLRQLADLSFHVRIIIYPTAAPLGLLQLILIVMLPNYRPSGAYYNS
jgi:hypothetical protein